MENYITSKVSYETIKEKLTHYFVRQNLPYLKNYESIDEIKMRDLCPHFFDNIDLEAFVYTQFDISPRYINTEVYKTFKELVFNVYLYSCYRQIYLNHIAQGNPFYCLEGRLIRDYNAKTDENVFFLHYPNQQALDISFKIHKEKPRYFFWLKLKSFLLGRDIIYCDISDAT